MNDTKLNNKITDGPLFSNMLLFTLPLMATAILQTLYSAADMMVLGLFDSSASVGAVGATTSINHLIINLFLGLSAGTTVTVAHALGAKREKDVGDTVGTSMALALILGVIVTLMGILLSRPALALMKTPDDIIEDSILYMRLVFLGMTPNLVYNYGAAILRADGDSKRPLLILALTGLANVIMNFIFVYFFNMGVAGVALSTALSQLMSGIAVVICLIKSNDCTKLYLNRIKIYKDKFFKIISVGLPSGIQGCLFSVSNVLIQSSINSFGTPAISGNSAASNIDGLLTVTLNTMSQTALTFVSQNFGAKKFKRMSKVFLYAAILVVVFGIIMSVTVYILDEPLLRIFLKDDAQAVSFGKVRIFYIGLFAAVAGLMDLTSGNLRGMNCSLSSMIIHLVGVCVFRVIWIYTVFAKFHSIEILYASYPISWLITFVFEYLYYLYVKKKLINNVKEFENSLNHK